MTMNSSGPISLGGSTFGQSIALQLDLLPTSTISLNDSAVRTLAEVPNGQIIMPDDFYGKGGPVERTWITTMVGYGEQPPVGTVPGWNYECFWGWDTPTLISNNGGPDSATFYCFGYPNVNYILTVAEFNGLPFPNNNLLANPAWDNLLRIEIFRESTGAPLGTFNKSAFTVFNNPALNSQPSARLQLSSAFYFPVIPGEDGSNNPNIIDPTTGGPGNRIRWVFSA